MSHDIKGGDPTKGVPLRDARMMLPKEVQALLPEENIEYYERTNTMHCGRGEGGSKFADAAITNIFDVLKKCPDFAERVRNRVDDRDALKAAGASERAFLPVTNAPEGVPEALYFKVDGIEGRLGIVQLSQLSPDTRVLVQREKGKSDPKAKDYTPCSMTVVQGEEKDLPRTDFATIIVGREKGQSDSAWTIHPGAPIRPTLKDIPGTEALLSPQEVGDKPQNVKVMTVKELLDSKAFSPEDYIKIVPGNLDTLLKEKGYRVE